jgi:hypothetical protein|tara:strand:- start:757 stop:1140 length:384 start_codon:yes stop_codon:yes gene_type:complete
MKYIIYDSSGNITTQIDCLEGEIENYISGELQYLQYEESAINKSVRNGEVIDKPIQDRKVNRPTVTIRKYRNALLTESDWTQSADSPLTETKKSEWASYRQLLRDIPATYSDATSIDDITWPTQPEN